MNIGAREGSRWVMKCEEPVGLGAIEASDEMQMLAVALVLTVGVGWRPGALSWCWGLC